LLDAEGNGINPFITTYSFPNGHSSQGNIPKIDTLMFDFDIEADDAENKDSWRRDLSKLLARIRTVVRYLIDADLIHPWRFSLTGKKGVHGYLDFHTLSENLGSIQQYKTGLRSYVDRVIASLEELTGVTRLHEFVDVDSSDLGRLTRAPNTIHPGATKLFNEPRYCVPVAAEELAELTPNRYAELTKAPRLVPRSAKRSPSESAHQIIEQHIIMARDQTTSYNLGSVDYSRVEAYQTQANDKLDVDDVDYALLNYPCGRQFITREDAFDHGHQSHSMEMFIILRLIDHGFPIAVIKSWFSQHDNYDDSWTDRQIRQFISRGYQPMSCRKLSDLAPALACSSCPACKPATRKT
jgi:hypothetical protein